MASERFEMRIDTELLERLDNWRQSEDDMPSRAEAIRRLIEAGMVHDNKSRMPHLSDGEKLIAVMLGDLTKALNVDVPSTDLVQSAISGGHYWALGWEMQHIFHGHADKQSRVTFVVDVLDMWSFMEEGFEALSPEDKARLAQEAKPFGEHVQFPGFDGNNESEHIGIARFLIDDLKKFSRFSKGHDLNSHCPTIERYSKMLRVFEPIRATLIGRRLSVNELVSILNRM